MKIRRLHFLFILPFSLMTLGMLDSFRKSSEAKINSFSNLRGSELPCVAVNTEAQKPIKSREKYRRAEVFFFNTFDEAFSYYKHPEKSAERRLSRKCRIRGRGNSTWTTFDTSKRSYLLKFDNEAEVFGLPSARKWILQGNVTDKTSLRNAYAYHLGASVFTNAGWSPKTQFVHLFINGKFVGLYGLMEKAEIAPNRIPLPSDPDDESFLAEVNSRLNRAWNFRSNEGVALSIREKEGAGTDYYRNAEHILQNFEHVLFGDGFMERDTGYRAYIDFESFVDWYLVNEFTKNHDARFQDSCFMRYSSADKKIYMGPIWDFDISAGNINYHDCDKTSGLWIQSRHWFERLWQDSYFRERVAERWRDCRAQIEESFLWIEEAANQLEDDANLDDSVWQRFGYRQWPNAPGFKERTSYRAEVTYMEEWLKERAAWLDSQWL